MMGERRPTRVFLVEDSAIVRESYTLLFGVTDGFEICGAAASAEELLEALDATEFDILVTDVSLPSMSGIDLARRMKETRPAVPVVVITGHDRDTYLESAEASGVDAYVMKHEGARALIEALEGFRKF